MGIALPLGHAEYHRADGGDHEQNGEKVHIT